MLILLTVLASSSVLAGDFGLSFGPEKCVNDPYLNLYGLRAGASYAPMELFSFEGTLAFYPDLGAVAWRPITEQLVNNNHVSPDLSPPTLQVHGRVHFIPIRSEFGAWQGALDLFGGFGLTHTEDDLAALQMEGVPEAEATASQWHPSPTWGIAYQLVTEVGSDMAIGGRLRWDHFWYEETVNSTTHEKKRSALVGIEGVFWL